MDYSHETNVKRGKRRKNYTGKTVNKAGLIVFRVFVAAVLIAGFAGVGAAFGAYMGIIEKAPQLGEIPQLGGSFTTMVYDGQGVEIDRLDGGESREYAVAGQIPAAMKHAFIGLEDERFYSHNGVDLRGAARSVYQNLLGSAQGGSTITQQLIKNRLGIKNNTIETKLQEQVLAVNYEKQLTAQMGRDAAKEYILEQYMNIVGMGNGQVGVQAAALYYFGKNVEALSIAECAVIASITQNPVGKDPTRHPEENHRRAMVALDNMLRLGYITQKEYDAATAEDVYAAIEDAREVVAEQPSFHSYYVDQVITEVSRALQEKFNISSGQASHMIYSGGLKIYTPLNRPIQAIVDDAYLDESLFPKKSEVSVEIIAEIQNKLTGKKRTQTDKGTVKAMDEVEEFVAGKVDKMLGTDDELSGEPVVFAVPQPQSGMVVLDHHTGYVMAIAGGRGVKLTDRAFDRATQAERQPGSVFKVLASFAPAIDLGLATPATVIDDVPFGQGTWVFHNWYSDPSYRGLSTIRQGITNSMNIVAVKNMNNTGVDRCIEYLKNFGLTTIKETDRGLSTALGGITTGVTQVEVTAAYGAIANEGMLNKPTFFTKVLDHNGEVLLEYFPESRPVLKKTSAWLLTNMMQDVLTYGTGGRAKFSGQPIAGKTGTTTDTKDLMFVGYTPYYTAGIYLGYDQPKTISNNNEHLEIWKHVMSQIHENLEERQFPKPDGITTARVCTVSGKLAVDGLCDKDPRGGKVRAEYFAAGTAPTQYCDAHMEYEICTVSGQAPGPGCPPETVEKKVGFVRPVPYEGDAYIGDSPYEVPYAVTHNEPCAVHDHVTQGDEFGQEAPPDGAENPWYERPIDSLYPQYPSYPTAPPAVIPPPTPTPEPGWYAPPPAVITPVPYEPPAITWP